MTRRNKRDITVTLTPHQSAKARVVYAVAEELGCTTEQSQHHGGLIHGTEQQMAGLANVLRNIGVETNRKMYFNLAARAQDAYVRHAGGD